MPKDVITVTVKGVMPTANGCAVFLGNDAKTFVIYVDHSVGNAIQMTLNGVKKDRHEEPEPFFDNRDNFSGALKSEFKLESESG